MKEHQGGWGSLPTMSPYTSQVDARGQFNGFFDAGPGSFGPTSGIASPDTVAAMQTAQNFMNGQVGGQLGVSSGGRYMGQQAARAPGAMPGGGIAPAVQTPAAPSFNPAARDNALRALATAPAAAPAPAAVPPSAPAQAAGSRPMKRGAMQ